VATGIENNEISKTGARLVILFNLILLRVSNVDVGSNSLHIEWRKVTWVAVERRALTVVIVFNECVALQFHALEQRIVNFNFPAVKVCGIEVVFAVEFSDCAALVNSILLGVIDDDGSGRTPVKRGNGAVLRHENKSGRSVAAGNFEISHRAV